MIVGVVKNIDAHVVNYWSALLYNHFPLRIQCVDLMTKVSIGELGFILVFMKPLILYLHHSGPQRQSAEGIR